MSFIEGEISSDDIIIYGEEEVTDEYIEKRESIIKRIEHVFYLGSSLLDVINNLDKERLMKRDKEKLQKTKDGLFNEYMSKKRDIIKIDLYNPEKRLTDEDIERLDKIEEYLNNMYTKRMNEYKEIYMLYHDRHDIRRPPRHH